MRTVLAIETSTTTGSVAIATQTAALFNLEWRRDLSPKPTDPPYQSHAERLTPALAAAIAKLGSWKKIDFVAVGIGPGSFTGIRVGVNAAKAIGWSLKVPVVGIRSTDSLLEQASLAGVIERQSACVATINAQMGHFFCAWYDPQGKPVEPVAIDELELDVRLATAIGKSKLVTLVGDGAAAAAAKLKASPRFKAITVRLAPDTLQAPLATSVARQALQRPEPLDQGLAAIQPLYIRGSGAEEKTR